MGPGAGIRWSWYRIMSVIDGGATTPAPNLVARGRPSYWRTRPVSQIAQGGAVMRRPVPASSIAVKHGSAATLANRILVFRLLAILAAQLFDFATFTVMIGKHGIGAELNPVVANSFAASGLLGLFVLKLALVALVGAVTILLSRQASPVLVPSRMATFITVLAVIGGVFAGWTNYITI